MSQPISQSCLARGNTNSAVCSRKVWIWAAVLFLTATLSVGQAHETDQFTVPVGRQFADLRYWFSEYMFEKLESALNKSNARILATLRDGQPTAATAKAQSIDTLAWNLLLEFPPVINYIEILESQLAGTKLRSRYPGLLVSYLPAQGIYNHPLLMLDLTKLARLRRSATMMVNGTYFGTDKVAHFIHMGYLYFRAYRLSLARGESTEVAVKNAINEGAGSGILSENGLLGFIPTGVVSNGDKAADYVGMKLYINLTEPVMLKGTTQPPLFVRDGELYRLNNHVRRDTDFFNVFVSDHWDEALNPNTYAPGQGALIREEVAKRCASILAWYVDGSGRPLTQSGFRRIKEELSTYFGEDYGHAGDLNSMVSVDSTCFPETTQDVAGAGETEPTPSVDAFGRTTLWQAARAGRDQEVASSLSRTDANRPDIDGETPLHASIRGNHIGIARILLNNGASVNAANKHGVTALHLAAQQDSMDAMRVLLEADANPDVVDNFGCSPLHDAARRGSQGAVELLLQARANVRIADQFGTTPLHRAARAGSVAVVRLLLSAGASAEARNTFGRTPIDEARFSSNKQQAEILIQFLMDADHASTSERTKHAPLVSYPDRR